jgi:diamine N-acetyltransferase
MAIYIRRAVEQDYEIYCDLFNVVNEMHRLALPEIFQRPVGRIMEQDYFLSLLKDEHVAIFLACEANADQAVGLVAILIRESPPHPVLVPRRYAVVDTLAVRPAFHRKGVGRALMLQAEEWAASQGVDVVELNVFEFNQGAQAFYQRMGYATHNRKLNKKLS